jgi:hypothetical protein
MTTENKRTLADDFARHEKILTSGQQEKNERGREIFRSTFVSVDILSADFSVDKRQSARTKEKSLVG